MRLCYSLSVHSKNTINIFHLACMSVLRSTYIRTLHIRSLPARPDPVQRRMHAPLNRIRELIVLDLFNAFKGTR